MFVLTFHATKLKAQSWKIPKLIEFMESLTQVQDKLVMMGTIKPSKDKALVARDSRVDSKGKKKAKKPPEQKRDKKKSPTQCLWLQGLLGECGFKSEYSTTIYCDN